MSLVTHCPMWDLCRWHLKDSIKGNVIFWTLCCRGFTFIAAFVADWIDILRRLLALHRLIPLICHRSSQSNCPPPFSLGQIQFSLGPIRFSLGPLQFSIGPPPLFTRPTLTLDPLPFSLGPLSFSDCRPTIVSLSHLLSWVWSSFAAFTLKLHILDTTTMMMRFVCVCVCAGENKGNYLIFTQCNKTAHLFIFICGNTTLPSKAFFA